MRCLFTVFVLTALIALVGGCDPILKKNQRGEWTSDLGGHRWYTIIGETSPGFQPIRGIDPLCTKQYGYRGWPVWSGYDPVSKQLVGPKLENLPCGSVIIVEMLDYTDELVFPSRSDKKVYFYSIIRDVSVDKTVYDGVVVGYAAYSEGSGIRFANPEEWKAANRQLVQQREARQREAERQRVQRTEAEQRQAKQRRKVEEAKSAERRQKWKQEQAAAKERQQKRLEERARKISEGRKKIFQFRKMADSSFKEGNLEEALDLFDKCSSTLAGRVQFKETHKYCAERADEIQKIFSRISAYEFEPIDILNSPPGVLEKIIDRLDDVTVCKMSEFKKPPFLLEEISARYLQCENLLKLHEERSGG